MEERKLSSDIITAVISVFLSAALILATVIFCNYLSFMAIIDGNGIATIARSASQEVLEENIPTISENMENFGFKGEKVEKFLRSEAVKDAGELYGQDVFAALQGDTVGEAQFTTENVQAALISNLDELVDIATDKGMDDEAVLKAESKLVDAIKKNTGSVVEKVTTKKEIAKTVKNTGIQDLVKAISSPNIKIFFWVTIIVCAIAILALRYYKFGGFIWVGTNLIISSVFLVVIIVLGATGAISYILSGIIRQEIIANSVVWVFTKAMIGNCATVIVIAILCFIIFNFLKKHLSQIKNKVSKK